MLCKKYNATPVFHRIYSIAYLTIHPSKSNGQDRCTNDERRGRLPSFQGPSIFPFLTLPQHVLPQILQRSVFPELGTFVFDKIRMDIFDNLDEGFRVFSWQVLEIFQKHLIRTDAEDNGLAFLEFSQRLVFASECQNAARLLPLVRPHTAHRCIATLVAFWCVQIERTFQVIEDGPIAPVHWSIRGHALEKVVNERLQVLGEAVHWLVDTWN